MHIFMHISCLITTQGDDVDDILARKS